MSFKKILKTCKMGQKWGKMGDPLGLFSISRETLYNKCLTLCITFDKNNEGYKSYPQELQQYIDFYSYSQNPGCSPSVNPPVNPHYIFSETIPSSQKYVYALAGNYYSNGKMRRCKYLFKK